MDSILKRLVPVLVLIALAACATPTLVDPGALLWTVQFGTVGPDEAFGVTVDGNANVYAAGYTQGVLDGVSAGGSDAFVRAFDSGGGLRWTRQFGTDGSDNANAIAADGDGNVYAAGYTGGALEGAHAGNLDGFVRSYDAMGTLRWTRQFGSSESDLVYGVATDGDGNVYAVGYTNGALEGPSSGGLDAFVRSYDAEGMLRWAHQYGSSGTDWADAVATDASNHVYIVGYTEGDLDGANAGGRDAYVRSYDSSGALRWTRQFGSPDADVASGVAVDANANVFASGYTEGALDGVNAGGRDGFVRSYDSTGTLRWTRQFGSAEPDQGYAIASAANGNVVVVGYTDGLVGDASAGGMDAFAIAYDGNGALRWTRQFGTTSYEEAYDVAMDGAGNAYLVGYTGDAIVGTSAGSSDAFLRKYGP